MPRVPVVARMPCIHMTMKAACMSMTPPNARLAIALQREDVVLPGDLALRKAVQRAYQLDYIPSPQEVLTIAEAWRPYRSLATSYLFSAAFVTMARWPPIAWHLALASCQVNSSVKTL